MHYLSFLLYHCHTYALARSFTRYLGLWIQQSFHLWLTLAYLVKYFSVTTGRFCQGWRRIVGIW